MNEDLEFGEEVRRSVERAYRAGHRGYAAAKEAEELEAWRRENAVRLEAARYERMSSSYQRRLREREALARRARELMRELEGVFYGPAGLRLGSAADPERIEAIKGELERATSIPRARLEALVDGAVARLEAGDGRGARRFLEEQVEDLVASGFGRRPEAEEELDPRALAARIPRR
ncbi:MAG TPA: hypothetical protein VNO79_10950 [Actinomycetota bacterium]|nr:hypothetical protein [Actinomycetota bacterium]